VKLTFRPSSELHERALAIFEAERRRLADLAPGGELVLTGATSLPAALTRGDIDLHLRVPPSDFTTAVEALKQPYRVVHPQIWTESLATFEVPDAPLPTGVAVTPIGSEHDIRFTKSWALLAHAPQLLEAYNDLKRRYEGGDVDAYEAAKSAFFTELLGR